MRQWCVFTGHEARYNRAIVIAVKSEIHVEKAVKPLHHKGTPVFLMENHDEAYYAWRDAGLRNLQLVHVDAHHDMWPIARGGPVTVGNFLFRALQEQIVKEIHWVVPDGAFGSAQKLAHLRENLTSLEGLAIEHEDFSSIEATFCGRKVVACRAKDLPKFDEEVLLDVDVDYFVLESVAEPGAAEVPEKNPWCTPGELVEHLRSKVRPAMVTIAYSVNGGTTPIRWRHLGDELRARWTGDADQWHYFDLIREASDAAEAETAESLLRKALECRPDLAAARWHFAECMAQRDANAAAENYRAAVAADPVYGGAFNSGGPSLEEAGRLGEAELEYRRILKLKAAQPHALRGMGSVAGQRCQWEAAREWLLKSVAEVASADGFRLLGDAHHACAEKREALKAYESYLEALRRGERCLATPISSRDDVEDLFEMEVRSRLANLYQELKQFSRAEEQVRRLSERSIPRRPRSAVKMRHAGLLLKQARFEEASVALFSAAGNLAPDAMRASRWLARWAARPDATENSNPLRNMMLNVLRTALTFLGTLATSMIIARTLGPERMGQYSYALWMAGVIVALCHLGLPTTITRFVAERLGSSDKRGASAIAKFLLSAQMGVIVIVSTMAALVLRHFMRQEATPWMFAILLAAPMALQQALESVVSGAQSYGRLAGAAAAGSAGQLIAVLIALRFGGSVTAFLTAVVAANAVLALLYFAAAYLSVLKQEAGDHPGHISINARSVLRFAAPVAYLVFLDMVVWQRSEIFFLRNQSVWQQIAFYSLAYLLVNRLSELLVSATSTLLPLQAFRAGEGSAALAEVQSTSFLWMQILLVPACIAMGVLAKPVIRLLYGTSYLAAIPALLILLLSPIAVSMTDVSIASLYASGRQRQLMLPLTFTALLNVVLAFLLVPRWGATGAAAANTSAQLLEGAFLFGFSASTLSINIQWMRLLRVYASGGAAFLPAVLAAKVDAPPMVAITAIVAGCAAYLGLLIWMREITASHWNQLMQSVGRRRPYASAA